MFARSTTIEAQPTSIDAGIEHMREEVLPAVGAIPGCVGLSLLVDRHSGRCIATTAWESEEAMHNSADRIRSIRDRAVEMFGGGPTVIEEWEIAALHRDHRTREGACVRATWGRSAPDQLDSSIDHYRSVALSSMENLDGFCSASLMVDRASGRGVSCATFDSAEAMTRNRDQATMQREDMARQAQVQMTDVMEFELALAHLRVPELV